MECDQLISVCVQEDERIKKEHGESVNLMQQFPIAKVFLAKLLPLTTRKDNLAKVPNNRTKTISPIMQEVPNLKLRNLTHAGFSRKKVIRRRIVISIKLG